MMHPKIPMPATYFLFSLFFQLQFVGSCWPWSFRKLNIALGVSSVLHRLNLVAGVAFPPSFDVISLAKIVFWSTRVSSATLGTRVLYLVDPRLNFFGLVPHNTGLISSK